MRVQWKLALSFGTLLAAALLVGSTAAGSAGLTVSGAWSTTPLIPTGFKQAGVNVELRQARVTPDLRRRVPAPPE